MRTIFPNSTQREYGFHLNMREARALDVETGSSTLKGLNMGQVQEDTVLADAIATLRSRVKYLDARPLRPMR